MMPLVCVCVFVYVFCQLQFSATARSEVRQGFDSGRQATANSQQLSEGVHPGERRSLNRGGKKNLVPAADRFQQPGILALFEKMPRRARGRKNVGFLAPFFCGSLFFSLSFSFLKGPDCKKLTPTAFVHTYIGTWYTYIQWLTGGENVVHGLAQIPTNRVCVNHHCVACRLAR